MTKNATLHAGVPRACWTLSATVGPFGGGEEHRFYIEALDNNGLRSLGIVRFQVVEATLENPLLIVDDTRLLGDGAASRPAVRPTPTG